MLNEPGLMLLSTSFRRFRTFPFQISVMLANALNHFGKDFFERQFLALGPFGFGSAAISFWVHGKDQLAGRFLGLLPLPGCSSSLLCGWLSLHQQFFNLEVQPIIPFFKISPIMLA